MSTLREPDLLDQLRSHAQVALLDAIDKLRHQGMGHYDISLPQLIVCGDESSAKSSVLEGLTRLHFPTKDGLCTTFPTEFILRKEDEMKIICTIIPSKDRTMAQKRELLNFKRLFTSLESFSFPTLLEEARECMTFHNTSTVDHVLKQDVLQIRYSGPDLPYLTIVDLPGLLQTEEGEDGQKLVSPTDVQDLVTEYMKDERSIILAVFFANNGLDNQKVFDYIEIADPNASRTLGIVTRPDTLDADPISEERFLKLIKNQIKELDYGWHVVKNRSYQESDLSDTDHDTAEKALFSTGVWTTLSPSDVGIYALKTKLSKVLLRHICQEIPSLTTVIQKAITETECCLEALGSARDSEHDQRLYLMEKAQAFYSLTHDALNGQYSDPFFEVIYPDDRTFTRLRTEIQNLNIAFVQTMYLKGHRWEITDEQRSSSTISGEFSFSVIQEYDDQFDVPAHLSRNEIFRQYVDPIVRKNRQAGLPSVVNSSVIGAVFRKQSESWEDIATYHLEQVFDAVQEYLSLCLGSLMDEQTFSLLFVDHIEPELKKKRKRLDEKLEELLLPYKRQVPTTYDPNFVTQLEGNRARRYLGADSSLQNMAPKRVLTEAYDDHANSEILDLTQTFYSQAISVFVTNVTVLAVESFITDLTQIFDPIFVQALDAEKLQSITSESAEICTQRAALQQKLADLQDGKRVLDIQACKSRRVVRRASRARRDSVQENIATSPNPRPQTPSLQPERHGKEQMDTPPDSRSHSRSLNPTAPSERRCSEQAPRKPDLRRPVTPDPSIRYSNDTDEFDNVISHFNNLAVTPPPSHSKTRDRRVNIPATTTLHLPAPDQLFRPATLKFPPRVVAPPISDSEDE